MTATTSIDDLSRAQHEHVARLAALPGGTATIRDGAHAEGRRWSRACLNKLRDLGLLTLRRGGAPVATLTPDGWRVAARLAGEATAPQSGRRLPKSPPMSEFALPSPAEVLKHPHWRLLSGEVVMLSRAKEVMGDRLARGLMIRDTEGSEFRKARDFELVGAVPHKPLATKTPAPEVVALAGRTVAPKAAGKGPTKKARSKVAAREVRGTP